MENDQERRTILAVGLSLLIYMVYIQWFAPPIQTVTTVTDVQSLSVAQNGVVGTTIDDAAQVTASSSAADVEVKVEEPVVKQQLIADHEIPFTSDTFEGELHSREGGLRSVHLKNYNKHPEVKALYSWVFDKISGEGDEWKAYKGGDSPEVVLDDQASFVVAGSGEITPDQRYRLSRDGDSLVATGQVESGLKITKRYQQGNDPNVVDVVVRFENRSSQSIRDLWVGVSAVLDGEAGMYENVNRPVVVIINYRQDQQTNL